MAKGQYAVIFGQRIIRAMGGIMLDPAALTRNS